MRNRFRGVIFDMDGLMLDTEPVYRGAWQRAAADVGHVITDEMYGGFIGQTTAQCDAALLRHFGPEYPYAEFKLRRRAYWDAHVNELGIGRKAGLAELLDHLDEDGLTKGVATSTTRGDALICLGELASRFDAITTGDEVENSKPAPDIFLLAARRLGLTPEQCLVLEDSEPGARAGLAAGMTVIIVPDLNAPPDDLAAEVHRVCTSLHEVRGLFRAGSPLPK